LDGFLTQNGQQLDGFSTQIGQQSDSNCTSSLRRLRNNLTILQQMLPSASRQLPSPLVVIDDQPSANQKRPCDISHRARGKPQNWGEDVEAICTFRQCPEVPLISRPEALVISRAQAFRK
jgi:hypothetical protein